MKELPLLVILDLTGNLVCNNPGFRHLTIYHLERLKILNGSGVTSEDLLQAKDMYMGKLTIEILGEKIGHFNFRNIVELDLSNCKMKELSCLTGADFKSLRKLNCDGNLLVDIDCLLSISTLRHLSLINNRVERLRTKDLISVCLIHLEELYLSSNNISSILDLDLHMTPQLKILYLQGNILGEVNGLDQTFNLVELVLDKNHIKSIEPTSFSKLSCLRYLHMK